MIRFGLIGRGLGHSFSAEYFTQKFHRLQLADHQYSLYPLESIEELPHLIRKETGLKGLNVTIPYKQEVIPLLDTLSQEAEQIGAVNTIAIRNGTLIGYNTDSFGFEKSIADLSPKSALVLGNGGASQAVQYVLQKKGIAFQLVSRKAGLSYNALTPTLIANTELIINTTSLGMAPNTNECPPMPYSALTAKHTLLDLVYNPEETLFLQKGKAQGTSTRNGLAMLHAQAEASWEIWNRP